MKVYIDDELAWEGDHYNKDFPLIKRFAKVTVQKNDGTVCTGTVNGRDFSDAHDCPVIVVQTSSSVSRHVRLDPGDTEQVTILNPPKPKLDFVTTVDTFPPGSFYVVYFYLDQRDADWINMASDRLTGKPSKEELARLAIMAGKYRNLSFYDGWSSVPGIRHEFEKYVDGYVYDACERFKILDIKVWGYDDDRKEFVSYRLPTLEEIGVSLADAYISLFENNERED